MKKSLLGGILVLAVLLRFIGITKSFPPYHSDEGVSYSQGITIIKQNKLDASGYTLRYAYPYAVPLINAVLFKFVFIPISWVGFYIRNIGEITDGFIKLPLDDLAFGKVFQKEILGVREVNVLVWGRIISAIFGVGVVYLVYKISEKFISVRAGLISALLVAINFRQVLNSHINLPDIYNAFFLLLSLFMTLKLFKKPTIKNYVLAGLFAGVSLSVKFNPYGLIGLFTVHLLISFDTTLLRFLKKLFFNRKIYIAVLTSMLFVFLINFIHFVNFEVMLEQLSQVGLKYRSGRKQLDFFGYSYLYHYGIGKLTSITVIVGMIISLFKYPRKTVALTSVVVAFFFVITFYTGGSFYTRNFVTITPILLIFSGIAFDRVASKIGKRGIGVLAMLLLFVFFENVSNSIAVAKEYSSPWNFKVVEEWISDNISPETKIAAHSSVPIKDPSVKKIPYNFANESFSVEEFRILDADYIVTNLDWVTAEFYWWMARSPKESLKYWQKPTTILEQTFAAMTIREISDFAIYSEINSWQAPDSNYIVAKVPKYEVEEKILIEDYNFNDGEDGWKQKNDSSNLKREAGSLVIDQGGSVPYISLWESEPVKVDSWSGFVIDSKIKVVESSPSKRIGFITANFYKDESDVTNFEGRISTRLSRRTTGEGEWETISLSGVIPKDAKIMTIGFQAYTSVTSSIYLDEVQIYKARVKGNIDISEIGVDVDQNVLFPNSHGNL